MAEVHSESQWQDSCVAEAHWIDKKLAKNIKAATPHSGTTNSSKTFQLVDISKKNVLKFPPTRCCCRQFGCKRWAFSCLWRINTSLAITALPAGNAPVLVPRDCSAEVTAYNVARAEKRGLNSRSLWWSLQNVGDVHKNRVRRFTFP